MKASKIVASIVYVSPNPYKYKRIHFLGEFYLRHECFSVSHRGQHQKCKRLIDDKDMALKWIRKSVSLRMAKRWLNILGCRFEKYKKPIPPVLEVGERELIFVTHDECSFCANDGKRGIWMHNEKMPLHKKGNGKSIIVSEFLLEVCRRLQLSEEEKKNPNIPAEACCYFTSGKNQENYWMVEHLLKQIKKKAIPIFETKFLNATAVFAFDNSTNYLTFADDALVMQRMNKGPRGKQSIM
ncbi:24465_t:CDS:2 [Cetraspora pellucida]|uniref:24465_t:CDS:1 n=1 Tax=Cetraspora pellucida TaxID=1433469 RepID=A0A9N9GS73_9GLOM|nr:24465_t:CDS:2 [Cetraspora pellucida]